MWKRGPKDQHKKSHRSYAYGGNLYSLQPLRKNIQVQKRIEGTYQATYQFELLSHNLLEDFKFSALLRLFQYTQKVTGFLEVLFYNAKAQTSKY